MMRLRHNEFRAYLRRNAAAVFDRRGPTSCPIACFLTRRDDLDVVVMEEETVINEVSYPNPSWAQKFVDTWDHRPGEDGSGLEALRLLARIKEKRTAVGKDGGR